MNTLTHARHMRRNLTEAERILWGCLRKRSLSEFKFFRQIPIGPYIADFVCREKKLIVEVDGATHGDAHEVAYDTRREAFLKGQGYRVLRVSNHGVYKERDGVLHAIFMALQEWSPSRRPPPPPFGHLRPDEESGWRALVEYRYSNTPSTPPSRRGGGGRPPSPRAMAR